MSSTVVSVADEMSGQNGVEQGEVEQVGYIGDIPVRNLWLLMLYASHLFKQLDASKSLASERIPDDIPDLVAEILAHEVERRTRRNLSYGYQSRHEILGRVRGRIDLLYTERHQLLHRGLVACRFDELTIDTPRNRYVRSALEVISNLVHNKELAHRCRSLAVSLRRMGVVGARPGRQETSVHRFGRHDAVDRKMVDAARLAFELAIPTEVSGGRILPLPARDPHWIYKLYEKAVAGFYDVVLPRKRWRVHAGKTMRWHPICMSSGMEKMLPIMQTDIVLDDFEENRRIVIDTKFYAVLKSGMHKNNTVDSGTIYQIYAYLRSQEDSDDPLDAHAEGILLHPCVGGEMVNEWFDIHGHRIRFATVDLAADAETIRSQLLSVVQACNSLYSNVRYSG